MKKFKFIAYLIYTVISLILFLITSILYLNWRISNIYTFNPKILFILALIGFGWMVTGIAGMYSIKENK